MVKNVSTGADGTLRQVDLSADGFVGMRVVSFVAQSSGSNLAHALDQVVLRWDC